MKNKKIYFIWDKYVKATYLKQNWILRYYKEQKYTKLIVTIV